MFDPGFTPAKPRVETLVRPSHPETSRAAAESILESLSESEEIALSLVAEFPGRTGYELDKIAVKRGHKRGRIRKRLGGLASKERLRRGPKRVCGVEGTDCGTWFVNE